MPRACQVTRERRGVGDDYVKIVQHFSRQSVQFGRVGVQAQAGAPPRILVPRVLPRLAEQAVGEKWISSPVASSECSPPIRSAGRD
jgi:hypothetical protein